MGLEKNDYKKMKNDPKNGPKNSPKIVQKMVQSIFYPMPVRTQYFLYKCAHGRRDQQNDQANKFHPTIKFTAEISENKITKDSIS